MSLLLSAQSVSKSFGAAPLFEAISLTISDGDRVGLIGPNGAGKSTLLGMLAARIAPDSGEVVVRKLVRVAYVAQESTFEPSLTVNKILEDAFESADTDDRLTRVSEALGRTGFAEGTQFASELSGGWRKRLAVAAALVTQPDVLLLDEPTNHLDLEGIEWLESLIANSRFASVIVSHDRYFLENAANSMIELSRAYPNGLFRTEGNYARFLERKEEFLHAQARHQEALENRVRREIEWLRRGPKARATKAKARIDRAHEMIAELADLSSRSRSSSVAIDFTASGRKSKRLLEAENVACSQGGRTLFRDLSFAIGRGQRLGVVGPNGSGKTTLLRLLLGDLEPANGRFLRAANLRTLYFDQNRARLPLDVTLRRALAPDGDSVVFQDRVMHVASWAARFLFDKEQLDQPMSKLSGGERARVLIANLMLQPADVLLLDEPTNDLDIPTLEILEERLLEFTGALILVTHDRYLLDRVSSAVVGLDGEGNSALFADYSQWESWISERRAEKRAQTAKPVARESVSPPQPKKKLSYIEAREWESIESRIGASESALAGRQRALEDPDVTRDPQRLRQAYADLQTAQAEVDSLYERWAELEAKLA